MTVRFDPTNGDRALAEARADITIGRWQGLPGLCAAAGSDWDRRTFRMRLLAQATAGTSVAESWHESQPQNADALVLRAETEVMRAFNLAMAAGPGTRWTRTSWSGPCAPRCGRPRRFPRIRCPGSRS